MNERFENSQSTSAGVAVGTASPQGLSLSDRVKSLRLKEPAQKKTRGFPWVAWTLVVLLAGTSGGLGYVVYDRSQDAAAANGRELDTAGQQTAGGPLRQSGDGVASSGDVALERKGYVMPAHQILISPKVSGIVQVLNIVEGKRVNKNDVLAELEDVEYQSEYNRARAAVNLAWQRFLELYTGNREQEIKAARAELEELEATLKQLEQEYRRSTRLQSNSALAAKDFEQAESQYRATERRAEMKRQSYQMMLEGARVERIEAAWAELEQAEADLTKAAWRLDNCKVRAPVSGTILRKNAELGNLVNPIAFAGSINLCEMADLSDLEVDLTIEERDISKIFKGQKVKVRAEAYPEREYAGIVDRIMPMADRSKSAIPVRVKLMVPREEEGEYLRPEMGAVVSFLKKNEPIKTKNP